MRRRRAIRQGVYAAEVICGDEMPRPAAISIGVRPTVAHATEEATDCLLEAHILDFDQNLYGRRIDVRPRKYLRAEAKFADLEALRVQMNEDIRQTRDLFAGNRFHE